nr:MAG TPA: hypothetical protein [Crassvirales sp.]
MKKEERLKIIEQTIETVHNAVDSFNEIIWEQEGGLDETHYDQLFKLERIMLVGCWTNLKNSLITLERLLDAHKSGAFK